MFLADIVRSMLAWMIRNTNQKFSNDREKKKTENGVINFSVMQKVRS